MEIVIEILLCVGAAAFAGYTLICLIGAIRTKKWRAAHSSEEKGE